MKLFGGLTKRQAKKVIGRRWKKLQEGRFLKPGDLVTSCLGYNETIQEIEPDVRNVRCGWIVYDFSIHTASGNNCSLINCCCFPLRSREEIVADFEMWARLPNCLLSIKHLIVGIKAGKEVFDENGAPFFEFCNRSEKKVRFPKLYLEETTAKVESLKPERGVAADWDSAYFEGWASFTEVWPDETNPYPKATQMYWGYWEGRGDANAIACRRLTP